MIDTHAHLDACADRPSALLRRARAVGIDRIITVGTGIESCRIALELTERHEEVFAALGIDPHQATDHEASRVGELPGSDAHTVVTWVDHVTRTWTIAGPAASTMISLA